MTDMKELHEKIKNALLWLDFEDIEFQKKFSAKDFEAGKTGEEVFTTEITYSKASEIFPKQSIKQLIEFFEKTIEFHKKKNQSEKLKEIKVNLINNEKGEN